ncbi:MAG: glutamine--fructose-6-phosphate transaminase (isomerizing) [Flavonifractor plautii]
MCGIVGFVGREEAAPILLDGLSRLEYRGYDSAGIAVYGRREGLQVVKAKGRLQVLQDLVQGAGRSTGHWGWDTHAGPPTGSHQTSTPTPRSARAAGLRWCTTASSRITWSLREFLQSEGVTFVSQTDTEVVAQLLEHYYDGDILDAVVKTLNRIQGAYALGIVCADCPDRLIAARKDSPLILGYGEGAHYLASDVTALIKYTREVCYLDDGEIAELTADHLWVYDAYLRPIEKERRHVDWEISAAEKGGYEHFMAKEIMERPEAFRKTVFPRIQEGRVVLDELNLEPDYLRELDKLYVIACGSSYHVGMAAKYTLERLLRKPVEVTLASEFRYCDPIVTDKTLVLVISQSGETVDTLAALREAKRLGARVLSIVNVVGSTIARESDDVLYTWAGPEIAVATTKAFSTQLAVVYLIGLYCAEALGTLDEAEYDRIVSELLLIPTKLEQILDNRADIQYFASLYFNHPSIFFIGRNIDYAIGMEGSLKLKEISYIHSEAYAAERAQARHHLPHRAGHPGGGPGQLCQAL